MGKTILSKKEICSILKNYYIGSLKSFSLIRKGYVHSNYFLLTSKDRYVLRLYEERTDDQISLEIKILKRLMATNLPIPKVILTSHGKPLSKLLDKNIAIFGFLNGRHIKLAEANLIQIENLGTALGVMHRAIKGFRPKESLSKPDYDKKWVRKVLSLVKKDHPDFPLKYQDFVSQTLKEVSLEKLPKGLNHADFHEENIFFDGNQISGILDFDDCFYGNLLSDVGCGIGFWCIDKKIDYNKCRSFIQGYEKGRQLTKKEKKNLYDQTKLFMLIHLLYQLWERKNWKRNIKPLKALNCLNSTTKEEFYSNLFF